MGFPQDSSKNNHIPHKNTGEKRMKAPDWSSLQEAERLFFFFNPLWS